MIHRKILCILISAMALCSCNHKDLCYGHHHTRALHLSFDWRDAPDASPEGMCVYFHPLDGQTAPERRFDFAGLDGGDIELAQGIYNVICYNNDTEAIQLRGTSKFDTHEAFTREGNIFEPIYGSGAQYSQNAVATDERVVICPDMLWGCNQLDVEISDNGITYNAPYSRAYYINNADTINLFPHELVCHYSYEIRHVKNLKYATQMCATLSSMAPSLFLGSEEVSDEPVTIPFAAKSDGTSKITGQFLTFGYSPKNTKPHKFVLYVWFKDGGKYYYTFDVTQQIESAPDKRHVHLIMDGLDFPQPIGGGSGLEPSVDGWTEVIDDIYM